MCDVLLCHSFGIQHDGNGNDCEPIGKRPFVMSPQLLYGTSLPRWSRCSREYITRFLEWVPHLTELRSFVSRQMVATNFYFADFYFYFIVHEVNLWILDHFTFLPREMLQKMMSFFTSYVTVLSSAHEQEKLPELADTRHVALTHMQWWITIVLHVCAPHHFTALSVHAALFSAAPPFFLTIQNLRKLFTLKLVRQSKCPHPHILTLDSLHLCAYQ